MKIRKMLYFFQNEKTNNSFVFHCIGILLFLIFILLINNNQSGNKWGKILEKEYPEYPRISED